MRKTSILAVSAVASILVLTGAGCGPKPPSQTAETRGPSALDVVQNAAELAKIGEQAAKAANANSPEATAAALGQYMDYAAKIELQQFEKTESVDAPSDFPRDLIYGKGKIVSASDDSSETYLSAQIGVKTTDDLKTVRDAYKAILSKDPWKITSQSNDTDSSDFEATDKDGRDVSVSIRADQYSKLVEISIRYSGDVTK